MRWGEEQRRGLALRPCWWASRFATRLHSSPSRHAHGDEERNRIASVSWSEFGTSVKMSSSLGAFCVRVGLASNFMSPLVYLPYIAVFAFVVRLCGGVHAGEGELNSFALCSVLISFVVLSFCRRVLRELGRCCRWVSIVRRKKIWRGLTETLRSKRNFLVAVPRRRWDCLGGWIVWESGYAFI